MKNNPHLEPPSEQPAELSVTERSALLRYESYLHREVVAFRLRVTALLQIRRQRLYRASYTTFEDYCDEILGLKPRYAYYLTEAAEVIERLSPVRDILGQDLLVRTIVQKPVSDDLLALFLTENHFRPLATLTEEAQDKVIALVNQWAKLANAVAMTARVIYSAAHYLAEAVTVKESKPDKRFEKFTKSLTARINRARRNDDKAVLRELLAIQDDVHALSRRNYEKVDWLLVELKNGKVKLAFDDIGDPLRKQQPTVFHVSADPDLLETSVPDEFLRVVFTTMEKTPHHRFVISTQNSKRAAQFLSSLKKSNRHIRFKITP